jgi:5-methylthioadenosine/S-adenosylhomocysteine deaminase
MPEKDMSSWRVGDVYPLDDAIGSKAIHRAMDFVDQWHNTGQGRITTMLGPQGPDMISKEQLLEVKRLAESRGLMIHMHTAQGDREINQMEQRYGMRTPAYLQEIGYLDDQLLAVHLTEATDSETELIARSGAGMVLCSGSIGIIDGIVPPAQAFRRAGGNVALGSDQAAGNNCHNMFTEMKLTALFNKIRSRDPTVVPAWEALRMATIEGAHAIGLGQETGSIETGKQADLVLVNMKQANLLPVLNGPVRTIVPNLVYAATGREVSHSMVAGKWVMQNRQLVNMDLNAILEDAQYQAEQVAQRLTEDPAHEQLALLQPTRDGML